jgi:hypothetical protein
VADNPPDANQFGLQRDDAARGAGFLLGHGCPIDSRCAKSRRLEQEGFAFRYPHLPEALAACSTAVA